MGRIHKRDTFGCGGIGHSREGSVTDERFVDQDMFACRYRRQCSLFLESRRNTDVDGVEVRTGQQVLEALNRSHSLAIAHKTLRSLNLAALHGNQFAICRFVYRIGNDASNHSSSNDAESKLRHMSIFLSITNVRCFGLAAASFCLFATFYFGAIASVSSSRP